VYWKNNDGHGACRSSLGLPPLTAQIFFPGIFRRDYGAAGHMTSVGGLLDTHQLVVCAAVLTLYSFPASAKRCALVKERGAVIICHYFWCYYITWPIVQGKNFNWLLLLPLPAILMLGDNWLLLSQRQNPWRNKVDQSITNFLTGWFAQNIVLDCFQGWKCISCKAIRSLLSGGIIRNWPLDKELLRSKLVKI